MEGVRKGPYAFFRLSPVQRSEAKCFGMRRGEAGARADVSYWRYNPLLQQRLSAARYPLVALSSLVSSEPEYGSGARAVERISPMQPRYMRITDFGADGIEPHHEFAAPDPVELSCALEKDDLLFARSGATVGKTYLHEDTREPAIFAGYCIRFRILPSRALPSFVYWYTKTRAYELWALATQRPAGQPNINKEEYKSLVLPIPRDIDEQCKLVAAMNAARALRRAKLTQADALLAGLDAFLLATLGLSPPPKDDLSVYAVRATELGRRIDAYSNQSRFRKLFTYIRSTSHRVETFERLASVIFSGTTPLAKGDAYVEPPDGVRLIRSGEITSDGEVTPSSEVHVATAIHDGPMKRSQLQRGDLLIAIVGATIGAAGVFNRSEAANINQAIAAVRFSGADVSPEFACLYLRSCIGQAFLDYFKRPVARANINLEEIGEIPVLVPTATLQQQVVAEFHRRRDEARRIRAEAEAGWQAAKRWFEEQLLGPAQP